jgi:hypothetical protein
MLVDNAQRAVEQFHFPHESPTVSGRRRTSSGCCTSSPTDGERQQFARHLLATGSPTYRRAFGKALAGQPLTTEEQRSLSLTGVGRLRRPGHARPDDHPDVATAR